MKKSKKTILAIFAAVCLLAVPCWEFFGNRLDFSGHKKIGYAKFYEMVGDGGVISAKITENDIFFETAESNVLQENQTDAHTKFVTVNPRSPTLHEYLLLHGVQVKTGTSATEILSIIFDAIFYVFFFGMIFFVFRKFISPNTFRVVRKTGVTFENVVGMEKLKQDARQIMDIMRHPEDYARQGMRMPKGILLEGAPGNGKTLFARALAGEAKVSFIPAKATDFESMFMSIGPMKVKLLFAKARKRAPCIVFIDEFDGIGTRRNYSGSAIETENTRIVTALLNELDGFTPNSGVLVIAATNSISALDEALIRPGRFDARFTVPYPDAADREKLCQMYLQGKQHESDCTPEALAKMFDKFSCAQIESTLNSAALLARQNGRQKLTLSDVNEVLANK